MAKVKHIEDALEEAAKELAGQAQEETHEDPAPAEEPHEDPAPAEEPHEDPAPAVEEPHDEPAPAPKADEIGDEIANQNSVIRRRLERQAEKYNKELADRDATIAELKKQFEEFKAANQPAPAVLTRDKFKTDEEFVAALTQQQIDADRARQAELRKEQEAKEAEARAAQEAEAAEIKQRQDRFLNNVDYCFGNPEEKKQFMGTVKTYLGKGLGDLLDACPIASDYLLGSPRGPKVLNRLLTDKEAFVKVFDPKGITPMEQFYALKEMEKEIYGAPSPAMDTPPAPAEAKPAPARKAPAYGKPGAQGGGRSADVYTDPKARRDEVRRLLGY